MNDDTFEEKASFVLSPRSVFVFLVSSTLFLIIGVTYLIAFTSLREYIPGYADVNMRRNVVKLTYKTDSLNNELAARDLYLENLKAVLSGQFKDTISANAIKDTTKKFERIDIKPSEEDLALRKQIEEELPALIYQIQNWQQIVNQALEAKQNEYLAPIYKKVYDAVKLVAKEKGYTHVMSKEALLVAPDADDMIAAVAAKLKVTIPKGPGK